MPRLRFTRTIANRNIQIDTEPATLYLVVRLLVAFPEEPLKREPGANPGLPRSGKQERKPERHCRFHATGR